MSTVKDDDHLPEPFPSSAVPSHATTLDDLPQSSVLLDIFLRAGVWQPGAAASAHSTQGNYGRNFFTLDGKELYNSTHSSSSSSSSSSGNARTRPSYVSAGNVCRMFRQVLQQCPEAVAQLLSKHHGGPCSALTRAAAAGMTQVLACLVHQVLGSEACSAGPPDDSCISLGFGGGGSLCVPSRMGVGLQKASSGCQQGRAHGCCCAYHRSRPVVNVESQDCCGPGSLLDLLADQLPQEQQQQQPQPCHRCHCQNQQDNGVPLVPFPSPSSSPSHPLDPCKRMLHAPVQSLACCCQPTLAPLHPVLHAPLCAASANGHLSVVRFLLGFSSTRHHAPGSHLMQPNHTNSGPSCAPGSQLMQPYHTNGGPCCAPGSHLLQPSHTNGSLCCAPGSHLLQPSHTNGSPDSGQFSCLQAEGAGLKPSLQSGSCVLLPGSRGYQGCQCCLRRSHFISHNRSAASGSNGGRSGVGFNSSSGSHSTGPRPWRSLCEACDMNNTNRACTQALEGAAISGHESICELLLRCGVRTSEAALEGAAGGGHEDLCRLLLAHGVCVSKAALKSAARRSHEGVCRLLLAHGACVTGEAVAAAVEGAWEWVMEAKKLGEGSTEGARVLMSTERQSSYSSSSAAATPAMVAAAGAPASTTSSTAAAAAVAAAAAAAAGGKPGGDAALDCSSPEGQSTTEGGALKSVLYPELDSAPGRVCCLLLRAAASAAAEARGTDSFTLRFGNAPSLPYLGHVHGARLFPRRCAPFVALPATRMPPPPGSYRTTGAGAPAGALAAAAPAGSMPSPPSSRVTDAGAPATALAAATPAGSMAVPPVAHVTDAGTPATSLAADAPAGSMAEPQGALSAAADATPAALLALTKLPHSAPPTHGLCSATELAPLIPASFLGIDLSGALDAAAKYGLVGLVELLLACSPQKPASVDLDSALNNAAQEGHSAVCELLLRSGAAAHISEGALQPNPLILAAYHGHKEVVALLLAHGAAPDAGDNVALTVAASSGHEEVCALLLEHGARADSDRVSIALIEAASSGHARVCNLLLAHGARADAGDSWPLRAAAKGGHAEVCALLLAHGADARAKNNQALQTAQARGHKDVCRLLQHDNNADAGVSSPIRMS